METTKEKPAEENPRGGHGGGSSDRKRKRKTSMRMKRSRRLEKDKKRNRSDCRKIRGDFLCAEEFGKEFLVCVAGLPGERKKEVPIEQSLRNKSVGLLFAHIKSYDDLYFYRALKDVYDQLLRDKPGAFEIVFVPFFPMTKKKTAYSIVVDADADADAAAAKVIYERNRDMFYSHLMRMPWLSIPFEEVKWRKHLVKKYRICSNKVADLRLFDPSDNRRVLQRYDGLAKLVHNFGAEFYPFTAAREFELMNQYLAPLRSPNPSLGDLLASDNRDFLISFEEVDGDHNYKIKKVPISHLQGKVVGIYLFSGDGDVDVHNKLMSEDFSIRAGGNFEIVFVNVDFFSGYQSETSFHHFLEKRPWLLALPFKDKKIRALSTVLSSDPVNPLVIVGGVGDKFFVDPYGSHVFQEYGFDAYPFTRDMAVSIEKKRLTTQVKLADIFKDTKTEFLIYNGEEEPKPVSFLTNKRVLLYMTCWSQCRRDIRTLKDLQIKDPSFQVLFNSSPSARFSAIMPNDWLAFPSDKVDCVELIGEIFKYDTCRYDGPYGHFIAFDDTGKLLNIGYVDLIGIDNGGAAFPFISDETFDKVLREILIITTEWDMEAGCGTLLSDSE